MQAVGIIAEYNPFHNGHLYHINKIKEKYPNYPIILVLSGNFTQRGLVSILNKWDKTDIALSCGVDLVIELPFVFATQSADFFSDAAIKILEDLQVERLVFGSESNDTSNMYEIAKCQLENKDFDNLVKIYSKMGNNYPTAISNAIYDLTQKKITAPNDLLGISYIKTIIKNNYKIIPQTIKRTSDFHSEKIDQITSATAIRQALKDDKDITISVPKITLDKLLNECHFQDDYYNYLQYKILTDDNLDKYHLVDKDIVLKLKKNVLIATNFDELIKSIKSKHYTYNKLSRALNFILCNFTKEDANKYKEITYIRILGFNKLGQKYLNSIKKDTTLPIISKFTKNNDPILDLEFKTTMIYSLSLDDNLKENLVLKEYQNNPKGTNN